ncbi:MAG: STAS domain-containing protein [Burkholderiales bacterium]|nr:STAS domain-containing protein [Burkholderiales bacterium]
MLALPAQLTLRDAKVTLATLASAIAAAPAGSTISVDASALTYIDSSALAVLLECRRQSEARRCPFEVHHVPLRLAELARLYGVQDVLALQG